VILLVLFAVNLSLEEAIEMGMRENPTYLQAKKEFMIRQKTNASVYSEMLPQVSGNYVESRTRSRFEGEELFDSTNNYYNVKIEWDLTPGDFFDVFASHYDNNSAHFSFMDIRNETIYNIIYQYLNTLKLEKLFKSRETAVKRTENNLELIEEKKQLGSASQAEVLQGKVSNLQAQSDLMETKKNRRVYLLRLKKLVGFDAKDSLVLEEPEIDFKIPDKDSVLILSMEKDPLLNEYSSDLKNARFDFASSSLSNLFTVSFGAVYQYQDEAAPNMDILRDNYDYSIGFSISIPIFTGFSRINNMIVSEMKVDLAELRFKEREKELRIAVEEGYMLFEEAEQRLELAKTTLNFAEENYKAASERYRLGESTMIELLGAEESLLEAQYSLTEARFDWYLSLYRLKRLMGRLYEE
jgi:outer membrane protein TolC